MAEIKGFEFDSQTWAITMNAGDTGSKWLRGLRESGTPWTSADRCLFTVKNASGEIIMQRIYRLDDQWGAGDGWFLFEMHNNDTDTWSPGTYDTEWRFDISPRWEGTPSTGRCINGLTSDAKMVDGDVVRTKIQSTLKINGVYGAI